MKRLNDLKRQVPYQYQHFTRLPKNWDYYWSYLARASRRIVQDRFHDSELAYCYGRKESCIFDEDPDRYILLESRLKCFGMIKVVLTADLKTLQARYDARGDAMYNFEVIARANEWFLMNTGRFDVHVHMTETDAYPTDGDITQILKIYEKRQLALWAIINLGAKERYLELGTI